MSGLPNVVRVMYVAFLSGPNIELTIDRRAAGFLVGQRQGFG